VISHLELLPQSLEPRPGAGVMSCLFPGTSHSSILDGSAIISWTLKKVVEAHSRADFTPRLTQSSQDDVVTK
jgi:hypothetical protein